MERRRFVAGAGAGLATVFAGCAGETEQVGDDSSNGSAADRPETETPSEGAQISIESEELIVEEGEYTTDAYVAAEVVNEGDGRSGPIELKADWYNSDGNYLDDTVTYLQTLAAGETWAARIYALADAEKIEKFELAGDFTTEPAVGVEGLSVASSEMKTGDGEVIVSGEIKNSTGDEVSYVEAIGTIYDSDGVVLGDTWTNTTGLPADRSWSFETSWITRGRAGEADEHDVFVAT
jgi:hypothetical protein